MFWRSGAEGFYLLLSVTFSIGLLVAGVAARSVNLGVCEKINFRPEIETKTLKMDLSVTGVTPGEKNGPKMAQKFRHGQTISFWNHFSGLGNFFSYIPGDSKIFGASNWRVLLARNLVFSPGQLPKLMICLGAR